MWSWFTSRKATVLIIVLAIVATAAVAALVPLVLNENVTRAPQPRPDDKRWQTVAPGRVEPRSGEIKIVAPVPGVVGEIPVKVGDRVFAGEALVRLRDDELRARVLAAETLVAVRRRARGDERVSGRAGDRRKAEDAAASAERALVEARAAVDRAAAVRRGGDGKQAALDAARAQLASAQERQLQRRADLQRIAADAPLPTSAEGQLSIARSDLEVAEAALEKLTIRAPIEGSVLQINVRAGELAAPASAQPVVLFGDVSALRVRAEVDERDAGDVKIGQSVVIRSSAFQGRDFAGTVSFVAPLIEPGRASFRGPRSPSDVDVVDVLIDLVEPGPLVTGMKVDAYFQR